MPFIQVYHYIKIGMEWTKKGIPDHVRGGLCEILASVSER